MDRYSVAVVHPDAPGTGADTVAVVLWNPSTTKDIHLREFMWFNEALGVVAGPRFGMARITARGTQTTTTTPDADNCFSARKVAPSSGAVIDTVWSVAPTIGAPYMGRWRRSGGNAAGLPNGDAASWAFLQPCIIPAGEGIGLASTEAAQQFSSGTVVFTFDD